MSDEEQEYITLDEAAQAIGTKKGSLYYYLRALAIKPRKFPLNRHAYIRKSDVKRIQEARSSPWKIAQAAEQKE
ncbi:MAG: helix-turn-helix domain-containing protein [Ktedonobacteraceae bacterium]